MSGGAAHAAAAKPATLCLLLGRHCAGTHAACQSPCVAWRFSAGLVVFRWPGGFPPPLQARASQAVKRLAPVFASLAHISSSFQTVQDE